jgi:hypothetical protein
MAYSRNTTEQRKPTTALRQRLAVKKILTRKKSVLAAKIPERNDAIFVRLL